MSVFRKGAVICFVTRDPDEPYEHFLDRGNFVVSQLPGNDKEYNRAVLYSHIYINNKVMKCVYSVVIMKELGEMTKLIYLE